MIPRGGKPLYDAKRQRWYIFIQCERDINRGDEIFDNYGREYYTLTKTDEYDKMISFLNIEYYSGIKDEKLENFVTNKLKSTYEINISPDLKQTITI